jgi:hypothetical protein
MITTSLRRRRPGTFKPRSCIANHPYYEWKDLGLAANSYRLRDLWLRKNLQSAASLDVTLEPHASVLFQASLSQ